jgi:arylsulfatase A-like enzyme
VRVPLIVSGPGVPTSRVRDQVRHVDLLPTLLDLAGLDAPSGIDGRSLRPLLEGGDLSEEPAYMEAVGVKLEGSRITGARTPDFKYLKPGTGKPVLYSLDGGSRPNERKSVIGRYPEVAQRLEGYIKQIQSTETVADSGFTAEEEAIVEQNLRDLGYL